jgi:ADP-L-glycero-D-manno-heptose 6-epimerase
MGVIVVTGAAGFIGSCVVAKLNERNRQDLILVDHFAGSNDPKRANLKDKEYRRYFDKKDFLDIIRRGLLAENVECVLHIGACSSTTLQDAAYFTENNFEYSCSVADWTVKHHARFIYASSAATYGDGSRGYKDDDESTRACKPLNLYGESKQRFDAWILDRGWQSKVVGLKFFNVFGPNEYHKADMRSVIAKAYERVVSEGKVSLFKSYTPEYRDGDQMRDFIYVKDVVDVIMHFVDHPHTNGIYNVGTGEARSWNDLARAIFYAVGKQPAIEYIEMPPVLRDKYQNFTQADISKLRRAGYSKPFMSLETAVKDYVGYLAEHRYW